MLTLFTGRIKKWLIDGDPSEFGVPIRTFLSSLTDEELRKVRFTWARIDSFIRDQEESRIGEATNVSGE